MKTWLVVKIHYGNFDVQQQTVEAAGPESLVKAKVAELNAKRTAKDLRDEIRYEAESVKTLQS